MIKKILFCFFVFLFFIPYCFCISKTINVSGILNSNKGIVNNRQDVIVRLVYGANNTDTGFSEIHNGLEFLNGRFNIFIGSVGELKTEYFNHDNLKLGIKVDNEEMFMDIHSVPYTYISNYANSAGSVSWDNISGKPTNLTVNVSTANYAINAGSISWGNIIDKPTNLTVNVSTANYANNANTAQIADSINWQNITNNPNQYYSGLFAGENLNDGDIVVLKSDGRVYKGDNSNISTVENFLGIITQSYSNNSSIDEKKINNISYITSGLTLGALYYIASNGGITTIPNSLTSGNPIGKAFSSTFLKIYQKPYIKSSIVADDGSVIGLKIVNIGTWDMSTIGGGDTKNIQHGLDPFSIIQAIAVISNDEGTAYYSSADANEQTDSKIGVKQHFHLNYIICISQITTNNPDFNDNNINRGELYIFYKK
jgi:hypothetical protein